MIISTIHTVAEIPVIWVSRSLALLANVAATIIISPIMSMSTGYSVRLPRYLVMSDVADPPPLRMDIIPDM